MKEIQISHHIEITMVRNFFVKLNLFRCANFILISEILFVECLKSIAYLINEILLLEYGGDDRKLYDPPPDYAYHSNSTRSNSNDDSYPNMFTDHANDNLLNSNLNENKVDYVEKENQMRSKNNQARYNAAENNPARYNAAENNPARYNAAENNPARYNAAENNPARYNAAENNPARYNAAENNQARYNAAENNQARYNAAENNQARYNAAANNYVAEEDYAAVKNYSASNENEKKMISSNNLQVQDAYIDDKKYASNANMNAVNSNYASNTNIYSANYNNIYVRNNSYASNSNIYIASGNYASNSNINANLVRNASNLQVFNNQENLNNSNYTLNHQSSQLSKRNLKNPSRIDQQDFFGIFTY